MYGSEHLVLLIVVFKAGSGEVLLFLLTPAFGNCRAPFCFSSALFFSAELEEASTGESLKTREQKVPSD